MLHRVLSCAWVVVVSHCSRSREKSSSVAFQFWRSHSA